MNENEKLEAIVRQNPKRTERRGEAFALAQTESGGRLNTIPPGVTALDSPAGVFYDRSSVILGARARHGLGGP